MKWTLIAVSVCVMPLQALSQRENFSTIISGNGFTAPVVPSQELGIFVGTSYYTGELNPRGHFKPALIHPTAGLAFRYNLNGRYSLKFTGLYGKLSGDDALSSSILAQERNLRFTSPIIEGAGELEFNYFHFNPTDDKSYFTPYIFAGIAGFWFNPSDAQGNTLTPGSAEGNKASKIQPAIPFGTGLKFKFSTRVLIALEWGLRKTFTDYIDDVSTRYVVDDLQRGNSKNKDWYSFAGLTLTLRTSKDPGSCPRKLLGK